MKKALFFLIFVLFLSAPALAAPSVSAASCVLMEAESGGILYEKNADRSMLIASTTKILTALVVLENCDLSEEVVIEPEWAAVEGSSMYLESGRSYTVRELLIGLLLASGNDAAVALACHAAGSVEDFARLMNERAEAIGCRGSHFANPNGLDHPEHYATAADLARITREALKNETFCALVSSRSASVGENRYYNHNRLLSMCEGVFGVKTGYTMAAGRCLVSCCERGGMTLICVTLSAPDDWQDHMSLYDWGFDQWHMEQPEPDCALAVVGGAQGSVSLCAAEPLRVLCGPEDELCLRYELPRFVFAGVCAGQTAGRVQVLVNGELRAETELVYEYDVAAVTEPLSRREQISRFFKLAGRNIYSF